MAIFTQQGNIELLGKFKVGGTEFTPTEVKQTIENGGSGGRGEFKL